MAPGRHPPDGLARAGPPAALPVADAVLGVVGVIGVRGPVDVLERRVMLRLGVRVVHQDEDRGAERLPLENAGEDFARVAFLALRGDAALPRPPPVQLHLDVVVRQLQPRRTAVHDHAHRAAVRLSPRGDAEEMTEAVSHGLPFPCEQAGCNGVQLDG